MGPGQWRLPLWRQLVLLPRILDVVGARHLLSRLLGINALENRHPVASHYYLVTMATDPTRQGQGIGSALLEAGLRRCDKTQMPACLEATAERNLPLYERHGFELCGTLTIPFGGPTVWLMWRSPG
jgi:GNAT superfamily N-acetyltransferase